MSHYYSVEPDSPSEERTIEFSFNGQDFVFTSDHGVFSKDHIDEGSKFLLTALHAYMQQLKTEGSDRYRLLASGRALDMGCGYGVLGIVAKRLWPGQQWTFADVNERALSLCRRNAKDNGLYEAEVISSDGFAKVEGNFELIISNPPIRTGKATIYGMFEEAAARLVKGGVFIVVIGKKQGAASAGRFLQSQFSEVDVLLKKKGFVVYVCHKGEDPAQPKKEEPPVKTEEAENRTEKSTEARTEKETEKEKEKRSET